MGRFTIIDPTTPAIDPRITHDADTGLDWQTIPFDKRMTWAEAEAACKALRLGGHDDWRLPTIEELESIRDRSRIFPAIDPVAFPGTPNAFLWSSTGYVGDNKYYAWVVDFSYGSSFIYGRNSSSRVRAVRGPARQSSASLAAVGGA